MVHAESTEQHCDHFEGSQAVGCVVIRAYVTSQIFYVIVLSAYLI